MLVNILNKYSNLIESLSKKDYNLWKDFKYNNTNIYTILNKYNLSLVELDKALLKISKLKKTSYNTSELLSKLDSHIKNTKVLNDYTMNSHQEGYYYYIY